MITLKHLQHFGFGIGVMIGRENAKEESRPTTIAHAREVIVLRPYFNATYISNYLYFPGNFWVVM